MRSQKTRATQASQHRSRDVKRELEQLSLCYGFGKAVSVPRLKALSASRSLGPKEKADAFRLLGHVYSEQNKSVPARTAYQRAFRLGGRAEDRIFLAMHVRNAGIEESKEILRSIDSRKLNAEDRQIYWLAALDTAKASHDRMEMLRVIGEIPASDRKDKLIRPMIRYCRSVARLSM